MSDPLRCGVALLLWLVSVLGCAALTGRDETRKRGRLFGLLALVAPLVAAPSWLLARVLLTGFGLLAFGRALDLARRSAGLGFWGRVWLMVALFDVRARARQRPRFDAREARWWLAHFVAFRLAWLGVFRLAPQLDGGAAWAVRWSCGLVVGYALAETIQSALLVAYRGLGVELPRINVYPIASTTLAEFWGRRWNRVVSGWLNDNLFFPLARRRKVAAGIAAAFAGSTALHFWFSFVPLGLTAGVMMASYFVLHGVAMLLERLLAVTSWSPAAQRAWTGAWIALPSPLFIEPILRLLEAFI